MAPFGPFPVSGGAYPIAVAVSGGADSLCLAWLASRWRCSIVALIVDHGLRAGSDAEADQAARIVRGFGVEAQILSLSGLSTQSRVQERARSARYAALTEACRRLGVLDLLVAHHRSDQIETIAMRERAGSGRAGLAGMARCVDRDGVRILRPLLDIAPARLRATLQAAGVGWIDDPSNLNRRFERVRLRQDMGSGEGDALLHRAEECARARDEELLTLATALACVHFDPLGYFRLPDVLVAPNLLAALWRVIGARVYPPPPRVLERLVAMPRPHTRDGAMLTWAGAQGGWVLCREPAAIEERVPAEHGTVWDGRWRLFDPQGVARGMWIDSAARAGVGRVRSIPSVIHRTRPALVDRHGNTVQASALNDVARFVFRPSGPAIAGAIWSADTFLHRNLHAQG